MSLAAEDGSQQQHQANSVYAAIARTLTRSVALYFSRPVRLFRPSKVSGWHSLRGLADSHGKVLSPQYVSWLVRKQGWAVLPRHFVPPMLVNGVLGVVLWTTYSEVSGVLEPHLAGHPTTLAALAGASAGGTQALLAAPAENMRFALEGVSSATGWSDAWKEVFRSTQPTSSSSREAQAHEARQVRDWMREVGEMAGRGWNGWGWGVAKDVCGFALFFAIFDVTRRKANEARMLAQNMVDDRANAVSSSGRSPRLHKHSPRIVHAVTLVTGGAVAGLAYEWVSRPWDAARKAVHIDRLASGRHAPFPMILLHKLNEEGLASFFRNAAHAVHDDSTSVARRRLNIALRTLGRVGPWGVGFLAWEAFGPVS